MFAFVKKMKIFVEISRRDLLKVIQRICSCGANICAFLRYEIKLFPISNLVSPHPPAAAAAEVKFLI